MKPITFDIHGIKCDNPTCGWSDMATAFDMEKFHNAPCPNCGANLFTDADYKKMKKIMRGAAIVNFIFGPFMKKEANVKRFKVDMNGTGDIKVTDLDEPQEGDDWILLSEMYDQHLIENDSVPLDGRERLTFHCHLDFLASKKLLRPLPKVKP